MVTSNTYLHASTWRTVHAVEHGTKRFMRIMNGLKVIYERHEDTVTWTCLPHHWPSVDSPHKNSAMRCFGVFFVVSLNKLFNKESSYRRFGTPRCAWAINVLIRTILDKEMTDDSHVEAFIIIDISICLWLNELAMNRSIIFHWA